MSDNLTDLAEAALLDALLGTTALSITTPIKLALMSALGTDSAAGTEVTGGSYARPSVTFSAATQGNPSTAAASSAESITNMPATDVQGWALFDSTGTPKRLAYGLWSPKKATA